VPVAVAEPAVPPLAPPVAPVATAPLPTRQLAATPPTPPDLAAPAPVAAAVRKPDKKPAEIKPRVGSALARKLDLDEPPSAPKAPSPKGLAAATKKADSLYRAKDFKAAAATLREAAGASTDAAAKSAKTRATDYETIATNLAAGTAIGSQRPTDALAAFIRAQAADRRAGSAHQTAIRGKIAGIAPKAAASWMAKQNYEAAKAAADQAVNVGAGATPMVEGVRNSLERKAGEFYTNAVKLQKSKPAEAKSLARRITKMVPGSSPWYPKAVKIINASSAGSDDDE